MSNATSGVGALFRKWTGTAWADMGEVLSISGPNMSRETIDVTSLASTGGYREFIASFRDPGTVTFNMNFIRSDYDTMKTDFESDTVQDYEIVLPDTENTSLEFSGLVTELPLDISGDAAVTCNVTIKVTGQVTPESGSGS